MIPSVARGVQHAPQREHPAWAAWLRASGAHGEPTSVETLKPARGDRAGVYRLSGRVPCGRIIAKGVSAEAMRHEVRIYRDVLPGLAVGSARLVAELEAGEAGWLFLEDVGDVAFDARVCDHRRLVGDWLGRLHAAAMAVPAVAGLPDRSCDAYRRVLDRARAALRRHADAPSGPARRGAAAVASQVAEGLDRLEAGWEAVVHGAEGLPSTLAHGDFVPKNVRLRATRGGASEVLPLDWETAGYGVGCVDLDLVDLETYGAAMEGTGLDAARLRHAVPAGRILRLVMSILWATSWLDTSRPERATEGYLPSYAARLHAALAWIEGRPS